jgi:hypothetical protein
MHRATEHGTEFQGYSRIQESEGTESKGATRRATPFTHEGVNLEAKREKPFTFRT